MKVEGLSSASYKQLELTTIKLIKKKLQIMRLYALFAMALATANAVDIRDEDAQLAVQEDTQVQVQTKEEEAITMAALNEAMGVAHDDDSTLVEV